MATLPTPIRAYLGLLASAVDAAQQLIERAPDPVQAVGNTMQLSMRLQQRYAGLVVRGDEVIGRLRGAPDEPPQWATFDEDADDLVGPVDAEAGLADDVPADDVPADDVPADVTTQTAGLPTDGAGARFDVDDHADIAEKAGTPLVAQGDALVGDPSVIALPARSPARKARFAAPPAGSSTDSTQPAAAVEDLLPSAPPAVLATPTVTPAKRARPTKATSRVGSRGAAAKALTGRSTSPASGAGEATVTVAGRRTRTTRPTKAASGSVDAAPSPGPRSAFDAISDAPGSAQPSGPDTE